MAVDIKYANKNLKNRPLELIHLASYAHGVITYQSVGIYQY